MTIEKGRGFEKKLDAVLDFIARDSLSAALDFLARLETKLYTIPDMPYKFRKSIYFDDEHIRDYIFNGYVIPYLIDHTREKIILLGIAKYQEGL
jgi:plasmid stabilization system protein ParE